MAYDLWYNPYITGQDFITEKNTPNIQGQLVTAHLVNIQNCWGTTLPNQTSIDVLLTCLSSRVKSTGKKHYFFCCVASVRLMSLSNMSEPQYPKCMKLLSNHRSFSQQRRQITAMPKFEFQSGISIPWDLPHPQAIGLLGKSFSERTLIGHIWILRDIFLNLNASAILGRANSLTKPPPFGVSPNREPGIRGIFGHQETAWDLHGGHPLMQRPSHLLPA